MLTVLLLGVTAILRGFPETAVALWLDRQVTEIAARAARIERRHLVFLALMTLVLVAGSELLAIGGPLDGALVLLWDVSTYLDIVMVSVTVAAVARGRMVLRLVAPRLARVLPRRRTPRTRAARPERPSANDDDHRAFALAA